jgi:hypothetical protein
MYAFTGIEDNLKDSYGLTPWQRTTKPKVFEFWMIGKNGIFSSDAEENKRLRQSKYVRYVYRLGNPEQCVFRFEDTTQFSKGDSEEEFNPQSSTNVLNSHTFNFGAAHKFEFVDERWRHFIVLEGPRVMCSEEGGYCENRWTSEISGMAHRRFDRGGKEAALRRGRAVEVIKKACPGRPY